jgi:prepilin-type N-terminal cleavage/methylation domain-containing protein
VTAPGTDRRRSPAAGEQGFTLIEMIVALVVLALIMGLLASGARLLRGAGDRLGEASAAMAEVSLLVELVQTRLGDAVAVEIGPAGRTVAAFDGTAERLRFLSLALPPEPGEPLVAMELGREGADGLVLARAELAAADPGFAALEEPGRVVRRRLVGGATGLAFGYLGQKQGSGSAVWHSDWRDQPRLPRAVRIELDHARLDLPPIIVPIRQTLGTLCPTPEGGPACALP